MEIGILGSRVHVMNTLEVDHDHAITCSAPAFFSKTLVQFLPNFPLSLGQTQRAAEPQASREND